MKTVDNLTPRSLTFEFIMIQIGAAAVGLIRRSKSAWNRHGITALAVLCAYVVVCRCLRYVRRDRKHAQYPYKTRKDFANMTTQHAWEITRYVMSLEFPLMSQTALQFALFK